MKVKHSLIFSARWWSIHDSDESRVTSSFLFSILLNLTFVSHSNTNDKYIIALGNQKPIKISAKLMFRGARFVHTWDLFVRPLFVSLYLTIQPLIRSSVHPSNLQILFHSLLLSGKLFPWTSTLKVTKIWLFFPSVPPWKAAQIIQPTAVITFMPFFKLLFILTLAFLSETWR